MQGLSDLKDILETIQLVDRDPKLSKADKIAAIKSLKSAVPPVVLVKTLAPLREIIERYISTYGQDQSNGTTNRPDNGEGNNGVVREGSTSAIKRATPDKRIVKGRRRNVEGTKPAKQRADERVSPSQEA